MAKVLYEATAIVGERKDGKPNYVRIGTVFETAKGLSLKLDVIPAGNGWNGWVSLFAPRPKDGQGSSRAPAAGKVDNDALRRAADGEDDSIPF